MFLFEIDQPNEGLAEVLENLLIHGITENSRNGPVIRFPRPVCLQYDTPQRRLVTSPLRDANPFFHLFETMWMFAGMDEIEPLLFYNKGMAQYSDDGLKLRGTAYGHRWRRKWGDQLEEVVRKLIENPESRQVVMSMWDPNEIFETQSKDFACNLQVMFSTRPDPMNPTNAPRILDMTVTNRSNDLIYGAMGSNIFHFSVLHEYIAFHTDLAIGTYFQIANNLHLYLENETAKRCFDNHEKIGQDADVFDDSLTEYGLTLNKEIIRTYVLNDREHKPWIGSDGEGYYLEKVVSPLMEAYHAFKGANPQTADLPLNSRIEVAQELSAYCQSRPLSQNAIEWFGRRLK